MTRHYYDPNPSAAHDRQRIAEEIRGTRLSFMTDAGVFSKRGIDFGSRLLIENLTLQSGAERLLDVGCGYGPIGLFAAKLYSQLTVTMLDINERAVALARENARSNHIDNVEVLRSDLFSALGDRRFDVIVSNPPIRAGKETVHRIFEGAAERLVSDGHLWIVIQKKQGAPSALKKLQSLFPKVELTDKNKGYHIYCAQKKV